VFANRLEWIHAAIDRAVGLERLRGYELEVFICHHRQGVAGFRPVMAPAGGVPAQTAIESTVPAGSGGSSVPAQTAIARQPEGYPVSLYTDRSRAATHDIPPGSAMQVRGVLSVFSVASL
jgi:hypothetical protein